MMRERPVPVPAAGETLIEISACGVCRTDLHVVDGDLPDPKLPIVPGHEIVGRVAACGAGVSGLAVGARVACRGSTRRRTKSAISVGRRSYWPSSQWYSIATFWPST